MADYDLGLTVLKHMIDGSMPDSDQGSFFHLDEFGLTWNAHAPSLKKIGNMGAS